MEEYVPEELVALFREPWACAHGLVDRDLLVCFPRPFLELFLVREGRAGLTRMRALTAPSILIGWSETGFAFTSPWTSLGIS